MHAFYLQLTVRANAVVVFVNYSLSPEVRHPVAVEECYDALEWTSKNGASINADSSKLVVAGGKLKKRIALSFVYINYITIVKLYKN